jgi:hypothetical protein
VIAAPARAQVAKPSPNVRKLRREIPALVELGRALACLFFDPFELFAEAVTC